MQFSGQYLSYTDYMILGGTNLDITPFNLLEFEARKKIDERTLGRLKNVVELPQEVKLCVFKMIELLRKYQQIETQNKGISSENIDGYSVTYNSDSSSIQMGKNSEIEDIIRTYLIDVIVNGVPVLYLGVC